MIDSHDGLAKASMADNDTPSLRCQGVMQLRLQGPRAVGYFDLHECERQAPIWLLYVYDSAATSGGGGGVP